MVEVSVVEVELEASFEKSLSDFLGASMDLLNKILRVYVPTIGSLIIEYSAEGEFSLGNCRRISLYR
ncbi:hypothetical protein MO867_15315 [Microbulbifer sp. OS29]|uniref:Uncharacterized protein n=1 Tax=Microbulbifer okhotskensis TaxID=2926617 RepID=A0A9X2ENX0_9GAMM|nr:hypothetical protein [Microbulbifer okhotskensis]MCO1335704.1 hypothetical protein [Microbulbifer okhotskensis]